MKQFLTKDSEYVTLPTTEQNQGKLIKSTFLPPGTDLLAVDRIAAV